MRHSIRALLLGLIGIFALAPSCSNGGGGGARLAALAAIMVITNPLLQSYTLTAQDTYPKEIDTIRLRHSGTTGTVDF